MFESRTLVDLLPFKPSCTSLSKVSLRDPVRHSGTPDQPSGTCVNTNTCSIDAAQAHLRAHAQ